MGKERLKKKGIHKLPQDRIKDGTSIVFVADTSVLYCYLVLLRLQQSTKPSNHSLNVLSSFLKAPPPPPPPLPPSLPPSPPDAEGLFHLPPPPPRARGGPRGVWGAARAVGLPAPPGRAPPMGVPPDVGPRRHRHTPTTPPSTLPSEGKGAGG